MLTLSYAAQANRMTFRHPIIRQLKYSLNQPNWKLYGGLAANEIQFRGRYFSNQSDYGRQLGGFEYKEEVDGFRSLWRKPLLEKEGYWKSQLTVFASKTFRGTLLRWNPENYKYMSLKKLRHGMAIEQLKTDQRYVEQRLIALGTDLAAAHFVVFRGGAVKFYSRNEWIRDDKTKNKEYDDDLPNTFTPGLTLEAIDLSGTNIIYEGFVNLVNLQELKWLSFAFCPLFDNWFLDRVSGEYGGTLEYLDVSYTNISVHALSALYRFTKLKTLKLYGFEECPDFEVVCEELRRAFPKLSIEGVCSETPSENAVEVEQLK